MRVWEKCARRDRQWESIDFPSMPSGIREGSAAASALRGGPSGARYFSESDAKALRHASAQNRQVRFR
jgi:hypothetical protein